MDNTRYWLRGLEGPATPAAVTRDGNGLLALLSQDGWDISYDSYRSSQGIDLPGKLVLSGPAGRVRMVIDEWDF